MVPSLQIVAGIGGCMIANTFHVSNSFGKSNMLESQNLRVFESVLCLYSIIFLKLSI